MIRKPTSNGRLPKGGHLYHRFRLVIVIMCILLVNSAIATVSAQDRSVTGTVVDNTGEPMTGVTVVLKGTTQGVITDADGDFEIDVPGPGAVLVFSYVGYLTQEVEVGNRTSLDIVLEEDLLGLEEVIVIGYGTMKKSDVTGAVSSVQSEELLQSPVSNISSAIQGKAAGVDISMANGNPGSGVKIRIRGNRSITASNEPLVVLDGIPFSGNINDINPNDIQSIEVLKDASASAIYGSRGANGVLLVTTKRGTPNQTNVSLHSYFGPTQMVGEIDARNADEYVEQRRNVARFYGTYVDDETLFDDWELDAMARGVDTDWVGYATRPGYRQNHALSVSGGNEATQYFLSAGFHDEKAISYKGDYKRYSFRLNMDSQVSDWLVVGTSTNLIYTLRNNGVFDYREGPYAIIRHIQSNPLGEPFDENGDLIYGFSPSRNNIANPTLRRFGDSDNEDRWMQINPNVYATVNFTPSLSYQANVATSFRYDRNGIFHSRVFNDGGSPTASVRSDQTMDLLLENILRYNKDVGDHNIQATGLYSIQQYRYEFSSANVKDLPYDTQRFYNIGSAGGINSVGSTLREWGLVSAMGRFHYGFRNKYLATVTMRADGSSRLAEGNKWGFFPSAALSWRISEESFMSAQGVFDDLKLRASFGRVGNTAISPYQTQGGLSQASYNFGSQNAFGYYPTVIANPDLSWEMTNTFNAGLDFIILDGRVSGTLEGYRAFTSDLILSRQLPYTSGFTSVLQNVGKTQNTGFELSLMTTPVSSVDGFNWSSDLVLAYNDEQIVELYGEGEDDVGSGWFIGHPIDAWYYYEAIGIWQEDESEEAESYNQAPGSVKLKDQDSDGDIDADDRTILGTPTPKWNIGWNNTFRYKGFDLHIALFARLGQTIRNELYQSLFRNAYALDIHNGLDLNQWSSDNPVNTFPAQSVYDLNDFPESLAYRRGDFVKLKDITLGYTFQPSSMPNIPFSSLRLYVTAHNYVSFYERFEAVTLDIETSNGMFGQETPLTKALIFGLNVNF